MHHRCTSNAIMILLLIVLTACSAQPPGTTVTAVPAPTIQPAQPTAVALAATDAPVIVPTIEPVLQPSPPPSVAPAETSLPAVPAEPAPTLAPLPFVRILQLQSPPLEGNEVWAAQSRLLALGYTQLGEADGVYGTNTAEAVRMFQTRNQLDSDGVVGPKSWQRLFSTTPRAAEGASPLIPIVEAAYGYLLGATRDGRWISQLDAGALMAGGESYTVHMPDGSVASATGSQPGSMGVPCTESLQVILDPNPGEGIAVGAGLNPRPVVARSGDPENPALMAVLEDVLQDQGIAKPNVQITNVLIADLNADGSPEQVVAATRLSAIDGSTDSPSPDAGAGDYSLIVVVSGDQSPYANTDPPS